VAAPRPTPTPLVPRPDVERPDPSPDPDPDLTNGNGVGGEAAARPGDAVRPGSGTGDERHAGNGRSGGASAGGGFDAGDLDRQLERYRRELTGYCYRMLGGAHEAEDAVQETMLRAWKGIGGFEGRSALRSWVYRIATNVCLEMLRSTQRRALPMDLAAPAPGTTQPGARLPESTWVQPMPDNRILPGPADPADQAVARESIRLAFVAALQHLTPRQRAVVILRDVLHWRASEVAQLLDGTVVSVNSALQRGRAVLASVDHHPAVALPPADDPATRALLDRYVDAFERFDVGLLVDILHEDVTLAMPPFDFWLQGIAAVRAWSDQAHDPCRQARYIPAPAANGVAAFGHYRPVGSDGDVEGVGMHLVEVAGGRVRSVHVHLDPSLLPLFDLPLTLTSAELEARARPRH